MDRDIPVFNRPVVEKMNRHNKEKHLERLRNIKSGLSNRTMPMGQHPHTLSNKKSLLAEEQKRTEIQKQNAMLFTKMMRIMRRNDPNNQPIRALAHKGQRLFVQNSRIMQQNRGIFQRLQQQKPTISNRKLQEDRMKNINILKFLGKYPNPVANRHNYQSATTNGGRNSESRRKYDSFDHRNLRLQQFALDQTVYDRQMNEYREHIQKMKDRSLLTSQGRRKFVSQAMPRTHKKVTSEESDEQMKMQSEHIPLNYQSESRPGYRQKSRSSAKSDYAANQQSTNLGEKKSITKQITLFEKNCPILKKPATVKFFRLYNTYQIQAIFDQPFRGEQVYRQIIPEIEGNEFFGENNYNYDAICTMLIIQDGQLMVNPSLVSEDKQRKVSMQQTPVSRTAENKKVSDFSQNVQSEIQNNWAQYEQALQQYVD